MSAACTYVKRRWQAGKKICPQFSVEGGEYYTKGSTETKTETFNHKHNLHILSSYRVQLRTCADNLITIACRPPEADAFSSAAAWAYF